MAKSARDARTKPDREGATDAPKEEKAYEAAGDLAAGDCFLTLGALAALNESAAASHGRVPGAKATADARERMIRATSEARS
jgi:hypothetical protein